MKFYNKAITHHEHLLTCHYKKTKLTDAEYSISKSAVISLTAIWIH